MSRLHSMLLLTNSFIARSVGGLVMYRRLSDGAGKNSHAWALAEGKYFWNTLDTTVPQEPTNITIIYQHYGFIVPERSAN